MKKSSSSNQVHFVFRNKKIIKYIIYLFHILYVVLKKNEKDFRILIYLHQEIKMSHIILKIISNPSYVLSKTEINTLNQVKSLDISGRKITEIHPDTFKHLTQLEVLDISRNKITKIHPDTFKYMTQLKSLDIYCNKITEIHPDIFKYMTQLKVLYISCNKITEIHPDTFKYLTHPSGLESLYISGNQITEIHPDTFKHLTQLNTLDISGNKITEIHPDTFKSLTQLKFLNLSWNKITEIHPDTFKDMTHLKELRLAFNKFTEITFDFIPSFSTFGVIVKVILPEIKLTEIDCHDYECLVCHMNHSDKDYEGVKYGIKLSCQNQSDHVLCGNCYEIWYVKGERKLLCTYCQNEFEYSECKKCI